MCDLIIYIIVSILAIFSVVVVARTFLESKEDDSKK